MDALLLMKLYDMYFSGNCYKVRLLLSFLQLEHQLIPINLIAREQKNPEYLKINGLGQVPALEDQGQHLRDSQAILVYLARQYDSRNQWLPQDALGLAQVSQWLSTASNEIANGLAAARAFHIFKRPEINIELATARAHHILKVLNQHLENREWLELAHPTIADVACFPYVAMAHEGHIDIQAYTNVAAWVTRFKQLAGFVAVPDIRNLLPA